MINKKKIDIEKARDLLRMIISSAEDHPVFLGWDKTSDEINEEGGDAAFVTEDVAYNAKAALDALGGDQ